MIVATVLSVQSLGGERAIFRHLVSIIFSGTFPTTTACMCTLKVKLVLQKWIKIETPGYNQLAQRTCDSENPCGYKIVLGAGRGNVLGLDDKSLVSLNSRSISYMHDCVGENVIGSA